MKDYATTRYPRPRTSRRIERAMLWVGIALLTGLASNFHTYSGATNAGICAFGYCVEVRGHPGVFVETDTPGVLTKTARFGEGPPEAGIGTAETMLAPPAEIEPTAPVVAAPTPTPLPPTPRPVVAPVPPRPASAASTARTNPCPVAAWTFRQWTATVDTPAYRNPDDLSAGIYGTIPAGSHLSGCARPDGWTATTGFGWVRP